GIKIIANIMRLAQDQLIIENLANTLFATNMATLTFKNLVYPTLTQGFSQLIEAGIYTQFKKVLDAKVHLSEIDVVKFFRTNNISEQIRDSSISQGTKDVSLEALKYAFQIWSVGALLTCAAFVFEKNDDWRRVGYFKMFKDWVYFFFKW